MKTPSLPSTRAVHTLSRRLLCLALAGAHWTTMALPAQEPLLTAAEGPKPNLVLTLDNSGSMTFSFLAGANFPNEGQLPQATSSAPIKDSTTFLDVYPTFHPSDTYLSAASAAAGVDSAGTVLTGKTGFNNVPNLWGVRMRSSSFNGLYYNPDTVYQPWPTAMRANLAQSGLINTDGTVKNLAAVPIDPHSSGSASLSLLNAGSVAGFWCANGMQNISRGIQQLPTPNNVPVCRPNGNNTALSKPFTPMVYYRLQAGKTGASVGDFDEVDINAITDATVKAQQQQNFATWFTYYRNRLLMAKAATGLAFDSQRLGRFRLGYGKINNLKPGSTSVRVAQVTDNYTSQTLNQGVRLFDESQRTGFETWLRDSVTAAGGTPLREAMLDVGNYYKHSTLAAGDPYATDPTSAVAKGLACRKSFHILVTDGYWNKAALATSVGNQDGKAGPLITGSGGKSFQYVPQSPFTDGYSDTLADVAMSFWANDIRPDLDNIIPVSDAASRTPYDPNLDPAFWQHMVNYTVGLGVDGTIDSTRTPGSFAWPAITGDTNTTIDDLWHAAVNTRGKYLKATDPIAFSVELGKILSTISTSGGTISGVATSRTILTDSSLKFVPTFDPETWSGDVSGTFVDAKGVAQASPPPWTATAALPAFGKRNLWIGTAMGADKALPFVKSSLENTAAYPKTANPLGDVLARQLLTGLFAPIAPTLNDDLVNYLRGDASKEGTLFRTRKTRLGDFINSLPVFIRATDFDNRFLPDSVAGKVTGAGSYNAFLASKKARAQGLVVIGGNDGMLHGFREKDGVEMFGFVPAPVLRGESHPNTTPSVGLLPGDYHGLARLSDFSYEHQFYVDGQIAEGDIYSCAGGTCSWRNIIVANTGGGARNVFALDLTNDFSQDSATAPTTFTKNNVLWSLDKSDTDLGYLSTAAEVGMLANGEWAAAFGNGYDSNDGKAVLFIVNASTGSVIKKIPAGVSGANGLGGVVLVRDGNNVVVSAYAGDLNGNLWKFDLSDADPNKWGVDFGGRPLFTALKNNVAQPITAAPNFTPHPRGGLMLIVPTGKLYASSDVNSTAAQTIYGLWDKSVIGTPSPVVNAISGSDPLLIQTVSNANQAGFQTTFQIVADAGNAAKMSTARGWKLDMLVPAGERGVYMPQFVQGFAYVETVLPGASGEESCSLTKGSGYGYLINPFTGDMPPGPIIDLNGDGKFDSSDSAGAFQRQTTSRSAIQRGLTGIIGDPMGGRATQGTVPSTMRTWRQLFWIPR